MCTCGRAIVNTELPAKSADHFEEQIKISNESQILPVNTDFVKLKIMFFFSLLKSLKLCKV